MKKLMSIVLALCMALSLCVTTAWAGLPDAEAGKITLTEDVTLDAPYVVTGTLTIDLAGHSITPATSFDTTNGNDYLIGVKRGASLTIMDSVGGGSIDTGMNSSIYCAIKLTLAGEGETGDKATLTVNGGTLKGYYYAVFGNGTRHNTEITINGGKLMGLNPADNLGIYHPQEGTLTINGGEIVGLSGLEMRAGTLNITGGKIVGTGSYSDPIPNGSGSTTVGAAVAIAQHTTKKNITVNISGGTLVGAKALNEANPQGNIAPVVQINVTDGTFNGGVSAVDTNAFAITGGTFDTDVTAFVPTGTPVATNGDDYYVGGDNIAAAANSGKDMTMVQGGAIDGLEPGATIIVPKDVTGTVLNGDAVEWGYYTIAEPYHHESIRRQNTTANATDTTTDTTKPDTVTSAKTFDVGTAVYGLLAVTSLLGMGYVGKKR